MSATNIFNKVYCAVVAVGLVFAASAVVAATPGCPECPPDKDGSIFPGGSCENCKRPKSDKAVRVVDGTRVKNCPNCPMPVFKTANYPLAQARYKSNAVDRNCCDLAPFALTHVDFRLQNQKKVAKMHLIEALSYRHRLFAKPDREKF